MRRLILDEGKDLDLRKVRLHDNEENDAGMINPWPRLADPIIQQIIDPIKKAGRETGFLRE